MEMPLTAVWRIFFTGEGLGTEGTAGNSCAVSTDWGLSAMCRERGIPVMAVTPRHPSQCVKPLWGPSLGSLSPIVVSHIEMVDEQSQPGLQSQQSLDGAHVLLGVVCVCLRFCV